ncbi:MAG: hypothetical protein Q9161_008608 [Pseudevernia consocians]
MAPRRKSQIPTLEALSLSEITAEYKTWTYQFAASPFAASLALIIEREMPPPHTLPLTQCLCLGLGNFAQGSVYPGEPESNKRRYRSLHQLVFLTSVLTMLGQKHSPISPNAVYLQDPDFSPVERAFLQDGLGYTVLSDPDAYAKMTPTTFLFAPCVPHWVRVRALEVALPGLYVSVDVEMDLERMGSGYKCPLTKASVQDTFGRLRDVTRVRRLPDGEGDDWEEWVDVTSMRWMRGRTRSATAAWVFDG